jgi:hypothetical protein
MCYAANMKRTTIFLPDELHERLRKEAFRAKISMAELIRTRLTRSKRRAKWTAANDPIMKVAGICSGPVFSDEIDEKLYGI